MNGAPGRTAPGLEALCAIQLSYGMKGSRRQPTLRPASRMSATAFDGVSPTDRSRFVSGADPPRKLLLGQSQPASKTNEA